MTSANVTDDLPDWLQQLAATARDLDPTQLSRFLPPDDGSGRQSAVLMAFADTDGGPSVLLIERAADMRQHAGQVAFPGGSLDPGDASADAAAAVGGSPAQAHGSPASVSQEPVAAPHGVKRSGSPLEGGAQPPPPGTASPHVGAGSIPNSPRADRRDMRASN